MFTNTLPARVALLVMAAVLVPLFYALVAVLLTSPAQAETSGAVAGPVGAGIILPAPVAQKRPVKAPSVAAKPTTSTVKTATTTATVTPVREPLNITVAEGPYTGPDLKHGDTLNLTMDPAGDPAARCDQYGGILSGKVCQSVDF